MCHYIVIFNPINGVPSPHFHSKKGLRKGDPLSPFLFSICIEYLSRCLRNLQHNTNFKFHPRYAKFGVTHLMFAYDLLMFVKADHANSMQLLFEAFIKLYVASQLAANLDKK